MHDTRRHVTPEAVIYDGVVTPEAVTYDGVVTPEAVTYGGLCLSRRGR